LSDVETSDIFIRKIIYGDASYWLREILRLSHDLENDKQAKTCMGKPLLITSCFSENVMQWDHEVKSESGGNNKVVNQDDFLLMIN